MKNLFLEDELKYFFLRFYWDVCLFTLVKPIIMRMWFSLRHDFKSAEPEPGFDLGSTAGESSTLTTGLHMLYNEVSRLNTFIENNTCMYVKKW